MNPKVLMLAAIALFPVLAQAQGPSSPATCKVNIQTATAEQAAFLPGIGPAKAAAIVAAHPKTEAELDSVKGIGPAALEALRPYVVYTGQTTCTEKQKAPKKQ